jgi:hypothetical protein
MSQKQTIGWLGDPWLLRLSALKRVRQVLLGWLSECGQRQ